MVRYQKINPISNLTLQKPSYIVKNDWGLPKKFQALVLTSSQQDLTYKNSKELRQTTDLEGW